jgi:hypothetical protein
MWTEKQHSSQEEPPQKRGINLDLYYYERTNVGYSLRITPLGFALLLVAFVIAFIVILSSAPSRKKPNINITVPPTPIKLQTQRGIEPAPTPHKPQRILSHSGTGSNNAAVQPQAGKTPQ